MKPNSFIQQNQIQKQTFYDSVINTVISNKHSRSVKTISYKRIQNPIRIKPVPILVQQVNTTIIYPVVQSCRAKVQNDFIFRENRETYLKPNNIQQNTTYSSQEILNKNHKINSLLNHSTELPNDIELDRSTEIDFKPISYSTRNSTTKKTIRSNSNTVVYPVSSKSRFLYQTDRRVLLNQSVNLSNSLNSSFSISRIRSNSPVILKSYAPQTVLVTSPIPKSIDLRPKPQYFSSVTRPIPMLDFTRMSFQQIMNQQTKTSRREEDGSVYEGQIQNNFKNGKGKLILPDGKYYIGEFKQDKIDGLGELFSKEHQLIYEGEWCNNKYNGRGILHNIDISLKEGNNINSVDYTNFNKINSLWTSYEGQFKEGERDGTGLLQFVNGTQYFGGFQNDLINGAGVFSFNNEIKEQVAGCWKDSVLEMILN